MIEKKVLRAYTREEVRAALNAKTTVAYQAPRGFAPKGLNATAIFERRKADLVSSQPATSADTSPQPFGSKAFAQTVFAQRRGQPATAAAAPQAPPAPSRDAEDSPAPAVLRAMASRLQNFTAAGGTVAPAKQTLADTIREAVHDWRPPDSASVE
ncbi:hypothetical protein [Rhizobium sp. RU35A]|uniref:hypothetical protein n=1 Tax=Rhizobium sp. RU35A TaxID=1907414 RepID=UPI00122CA783|nr:hypothetical protein [Rhizobium sp. RU35A]